MSTLYYIVNDQAKHRRVLQEIKAAAEAIPLRPMQLMESPILGAEGNREFLIWLKNKDAAGTSGIDEQIDRLTH